MCPLVFTRRSLLTGCGVATAPIYDPEWPIRSVAMGVYWAQRLYREANGGEEEGVYAPSVEALEDFTPAGLIDGTCTAVPTIELGPDSQTYTTTVVDEAAGLQATVTNLRLLVVTPLDRQRSHGRAVLD